MVFFAILVMCTSSFISNFVLVQPMEAPGEIFKGGDRWMDHSF